MATREKKPVYKVQMTEGKRNIIRQLLQEYDIETAEEIQKQSWFARKFRETFCKPNLDFHVLDEKINKFDFMTNFAL